ncbi:potassium-transporting ATPase subunit KdpC [Sphingomonas sp.]|uniref:potassium-transporting ATPase subunit KdpC n=1 Tax=Sphingomonas sp. TaxID=28214 RepID=UPI003BA9B818
MLTDLKTALRPALVLTTVFALLLGLAYPALITGVAQLAFPHQANGSLIRDGDRVIGSELLGQKFSGDRYFHGRPSAAGADGYDAAASAGSNLGPTSRALVDRVKADADANRTSPAQSVPADLVTTSASGLDPHISPEAALSQVNRVAAARDLPRATVTALVRRHTETPLVGVLGQDRVNVLALNRALDRTAAQP